ncbi:OLC1v1018860C1 [Oldenlandia corymbosa var. corymbosa]|uniref:OLC1v1018860C1 n=1 Tax=Oldenlandia corymbosa var. corymbosa TaxID=529605 RepID=A0AAV1ECK8_OLDCO|nr:OLC1v1018860C1 [Oldenlandia corymbosa var. corymbosa]
MASSLITSINSALRGLEFADEYIARRIPYALKNLKLKLMNFKVFVVLCARILGKENDEYPLSLGSLLATIEDVVGRSIVEVQLNCIPTGAGLKNLEMKIGSFVREMLDLEGQIDEWYASAMSNQPMTTGSLTAEEIGEIADSIAENSVGIMSFRYYYFMYDNLAPDQAMIVYVESLAKFMDFFGVQMTFLKDLIRFTLWVSADERTHLEGLLFHFEVVAVNAARVFLMSPEDKLEGERCEEMRARASGVLQKIMPFDQHVNQTYGEALSSSRLLLFRHLDDPTHEEDCGYTVIVLKDFLDSLISVLWVILQTDLPIRDQMQTAFEALKFLRTIVKKQHPRKLDDEIRNQIGVLVCDAGDLILMIHQSDCETDPGFRDLSERIRLTGAVVQGEVSQASVIKFPKTNGLGFVDYVQENLMELMMTHEGESIIKNHVQIIGESLVSLRSSLDETLRFHNENEDLQALWNRVLKMGYEADLLTDRLVTEDFDSFSALTDSMIESILADIMTINSDLLQMSYGNVKRHPRKKIKKSETRIPNDRFPQISPSILNEIVGFREEITSIIDRLTRGSDKLKIVVISGMAGSGKTTLASRVYNDPAIMCHFHVRAWHTVSQVFDKRKVVSGLLKQIDPTGASSDRTQHDLVQKLWRNLKRKRYLIFLDDVWTTEPWESLKESFPDDSTQSRIILTSRLRNVVPLARLDGEPHSLRPFTENESMELLQRKLMIPGKNWPVELSQLGMQIVRDCRGLPLTIVIVAGLLAKMEQERRGEILEALSLGEQCLNTLELSYKNLPEHLKPCFLYFGAFPSDEEISVRRLIRLWIAEGFVRRSNSMTIENVAEGYMVDLIERSLVMVAKRRSLDNGAKTCLIHDLLHDFCLRKATEENFFLLLRGYDELSDFNSHGRRLCIYSHPIHLKKSRLFSPHARSLLFFSTKEIAGGHEEDWLDFSIIIRSFRVVKVLSLPEIHFGRVISSEIELLNLLRYLNLEGRLKDIPLSIGKLSSLQTLILRPGVEGISLPHTLWNLRKLKCLYINGGLNIGGILPIENLESSPILDELECFSCAIFYSHDRMDQQMSKFPNIRRLRINLIRVLNSESKFYKIVVPDTLSRLESLHLSGFLLFQPKMEFDLPEKLRKLTLSHLRLPWSGISTIGKLPNLEVLKLCHRCFSGKSWDMEEGNFPNLRYLKMFNLDLAQWTSSSDDLLPCLQKLDLIDCGNLEEIPSSLESIYTLKTMVVSRCSPTLVSLVKSFEEEQLDQGNSSLRIHIGELSTR